MHRAKTGKSSTFPALLRLPLICTLLLSMVLFSGAPTLAAQPAPDGTGFAVVELPPEALTAPIRFDAQAPGSLKMESALSEVASAVRASEQAALAQAEAQSLRLNGDRVQVKVVTDAARADAATEAIRQAGGEVTGRANGDTWLQAWIPVAALDALAADDSIDYIRRPAELTTTETTEGSAVMNAPAWHTAGYKGAGVKVAIIDGGFVGYKALLGQELPSNVTVKNFVDGETDAAVDGGDEHGTACAEIVYDIAPNASLYLAKTQTDIDLGEAVNWAKAQGVHIISTSIAWYIVTPGDGTGYFADLVESARSAGIFWATAAGNYREKHWGGLFKGTADGMHQWEGQQIVNFFGPGNGAAFKINPGFTLRAYLRWDDWTAKTQDFDLYFLRFTGSGWDVAGKSVTRQTGGAGQTPTEMVQITTSGEATPYGLAIVSYKSTRNVNFELYTPVARLDKIVTARSLGNLADSPGAMTVAALDVKVPYPQEPYSSEGPTNGPGGAATGGAAKPDIAAFANVSSVSYPDGFNGTSAATPHVVGAAAVVKSANPGWGPAQIRSFLEGRAIDMGAAGKDTLFGYGRLNLGAPPDANPTARHIYLPIIGKPGGVQPPVLPAPVLNPINNGGSSTYTVSWNAVATATSYTLEEADDSAFTSSHTLYTGPSTSFGIEGNTAGTYYYRVKAANASSTSAWSNVQSATVTEQSPWTTILEDDFEGSFPGQWQLYKSKGDYNWGQSTCKAASGTHSAWGVGGNGLQCGSNYPNDVMTWMYYGPFSTEGASVAAVIFKAWMNVELNADGMCLLASTDGENFNGMCYTGDSKTWTDAAVDLSNMEEVGDLRNKPQVWFAFVFLANATNNVAEGLFVDDVMVVKCAGSGCDSGAPPAFRASEQLNGRPAHMVLPTR